jgi:hypothetical protein
MNNTNILEREINQLENKSRTKAEEALLIIKKRELGELLKKQSNATNNVKPSDKTALYVGCGIVGVVLVNLSVFLVIKK